MNEHLSTDLLMDFVHGELSPTKDAMAHAHLARCGACREAYELETTLSEALRAAAKAEEREMPSLVSAAVWARIRSAEPGPLAKLAAWLRPAYALPVAAALLIGGFFVSPLAHPAVHHTIDASYYLEAHAAQTSATPLSEPSTATVLETSMIAPTAASVFQGPGDAYVAAGAVDDVR